MTLTDLRYLVALAHERHFGRAAEKCHVSQPTLSVAVKKVEEELGIQLFERSASEVKITETGRRIVAQAEKVLMEAGQIQEIAAAGKDPLAGPLRVGVIYTIGPYLLPRLIPRVHQLAPKMPLIIQENFTARLAEALKRGELDVIVISLPFDEAGVVAQPVYDEPFRVLMPAGHPWNAESEIDPLHLADDQLLLLGAGNCFRDQVLEVCPEFARFSSDTDGIRKSFEGSSLETIKHMVASGMGITVVPQLSVPAEQQQQPADLTLSLSEGRLAPAFDREEPEMVEALQAIVAQTDRVGAGGLGAPHGNMRDTLARVFAEFSY